MPKLEIEETEQRVMGGRRAAVQAGILQLLTQLAILPGIEEAGIDVDEFAEWITTGIVFVAMGLYWLTGDLLQRQGLRVSDSVLLRLAGAVVDAAMGGGRRPTYLGEGTVEVIETTSTPVVGRDPNEPGL